MTNKEAIEILKNHKPNDIKNAYEIGQALEMAISALSKTPSETETRTEEFAEYFKKSEVVEYVQSYIHEIITESGVDKNAHTNQVVRSIANGLEELPTYSANLVKESGVLVKDLVKEDLISRKAVLDCFDGELILHIRTGKTEIQKYLQMVVDRIKELPTIPQVDIQDGDYIPAEDLLNECYDIVIDGERFRVCQEESIIGLAMSKGIKLPQTDYESHEEFGWCKGCKEYDTEKHCCHRYSSFIRESLQDNINAVLEDIIAEIKVLQEGETQVYGKGSWNFVGKCLAIIDKHISRKE